MEHETSREPYFSKTKVQVDIEFTDPRVIRVLETPEASLSSGLPDTTQDWDEFQFFWRRNPDGQDSLVFSFHSECFHHQMRIIDNLALITMQNLLDAHDVSDAQMSRVIHQHSIMEEVPLLTIDITDEAQAIILQYKQTSG
jgi:hypothetical protein